MRKREVEMKEGREGNSRRLLVETKWSTLGSFLVKVLGEGPKVGVEFDK